MVAIGLVTRSDYLPYKIDDSNGAEQGYLRFLPELRNSDKGGIEDNHKSNLSLKTSLQLRC